MARTRTPVDEEGGGLYFSEERTLAFFSSGCTLLDCALGGGYPVGRVVNIVGDSSTGKSLLAIEACANFLQAYPNGRAVYLESEAAFDPDYARSIGLPERGFELVTECYTVENWYDHLTAFVDGLGGSPGLYVVDSLDALSDEKEQGRSITDDTYGTKAKKLSETFRRIIKKMADANLTLLVVSQVRENIGVAFGEKYKRSGGKALQFYCSQVLWLAQVKKLYRELGSVKRAVGIQVKANCKKNRVGPPFRECEFPIIFGYGMDSVAASVGWLHEVKRLGEFEETGRPNVLVGKIHSLSDDEYFDRVEVLDGVVKKVWKDIEDGFRPTRKKYV